jgi:hypothetical protein
MLDHPEARTRAAAVRNWATDTKRGAVAQQLS